MPPAAPSLPLLLQAETSGTLLQATLRHEFPAIAIGILLLAAGIGVAALYLIRGKFRESSLLYFGLFCSLYAVRLLGDQRAIQVISNLPARVWPHLDWAITRVIVIPFTLFVMEVVGNRWRGLLLPLLYAQVALAVLAEAADILHRGLGPAQHANDLLVIIAFVVIFAVIIASRLQKKLTREIAVLGAGYLVFALFVLDANLVNLGVIGGRALEPIGFVIFAGCLGYVAVHRSLGNEQELLSVRKELEIARRIQSSILPASMPQVAGVNIAARYVPMSAVAGDFYDFLVLDEKRVGILVADVTGHGVPAALIASMVKVAFAAQLAHAAEPDRVLAGLNQALCGKFEEHFVTAAYIFVDADARELHYAGAGHPPLVARSRSTRAVRQISENGLFLGCIADAPYSTAHIPIAPGDRFILCTDGVLECANRSQVEFGQERLGASLETHARASASEFSDALLGELGRWAERPSGEGHSDDVTFVVVDFTDATTDAAKA
jgi:sigma-B regulation protein RsbU (phosphoserine phosphatase)